MTGLWEVEALAGQLGVASCRLKGKGRFEWFVHMLSGIVIMYEQVCRG